MLPRHAITFDVDWAPDWAIESCAALCRQHGIPATFFVTHASPLLRELAQDPLFELGIHPNFLSGSSHGRSFSEVIEFCLALVPGARAMRTHDLFGCSSLFALIVGRYGQIETDSSLFLPGCRSCEPVINYHGDPARALVRVPFSFADNVAARSPGWSWDREPSLTGGLMVFDFHPALIALNLGAPGAYMELKAATGSRPLQEATREDFAPFVNAGPGASTYLQHLLQRLAPSDCATISDFAAAHRGGADRLQEQ
jgi:hypothetical protein